MKNRGFIILALLCAFPLVLALVSFFGIGPSQVLGVGGISLGLDLRGGVTILYEANIPDPSAEDMNAANNLLRRRLDERGYTEATTGREGSRQIRVNIPGVEDPERAVAEIGRTAMLSFQDEAGNTLLTGAEVSRARRMMDQGHAGVGRIVVGLDFTSEGARLFENATRDNLGQVIYIYMDERIVSAPVVNSVIMGGNAIIDGGHMGFTAEEADELANAINQGALPFGLTVVSMNSVGAQLGADALETSVIAGVIGVVLMIVSLIVVYKLSGIMASVALLSYAFLMLVLISGFGITLTLPGMAGIILSIGMALDANVIIFERIREEIATGRSLRSAFNAGFKRAFPAVLDCNLTTLMAAGALFWQGTGPIQGFALTLGLGIAVSMFSALVLTRLMITALFNLGLRDAKWFGTAPAVDADGQAKPLLNLPVIEWRRRYFFFSAAVLALGLASMIFHSSQGRGMFNLDVEFSGGTSFQIEMGQPFVNSEIAAIVYEVTGQPSPQVQSIGADNTAMIRMHSIDGDTRSALMEAISMRYGLSSEAFTYADVSPTVSADMQRAALWAVLIACLLMLVYITYRFKDARMGASTVFTLLHDAFMTIAVFAILRIPLNYAFIAVLLTIMGYSINATIVIFDRLRENRSRMMRADNATLVNVSVSQTLRRSMLTSATTFLMVLSLFIVGVPSIRDFALPIMIGLFFGTYSSVFLSGSFWYMLSQRAGERKQWNTAST